MNHQAWMQSGSGRYSWTRYSLRSLLVGMLVIASFLAGRASHKRYPTLADALESLKWTTPVQSSIVELSPDDIRAFINRSIDRDLVVVYWNSTDPLCQRMEETIEEFADELPAATVGRIDVLKHRKWASMRGMHFTPVVRFYRVHSDWAAAHGTASLEYLRELMAESPARRF